MQHHCSNICKETKWYESFTCNETIKRVWEFCIHSNSNISTAYIPGKHKFLADLPSREIHDSIEWMLEPSIFIYLIDKFGRPKIDMLASRLNKQIQIYASWHIDSESSITDAFTKNWNNMFIYAFPHCSIAWRVLQKIQEERRKTLIIALLWATQICVTRIMELPISLPIIISNQYTKLPETSKRHPTHPKLWMMALLITNRYHLQNQFRKMHKQIYQQCGETLQNRNTTIHSNDGPIFVVKEVSIYCTHQQKTW